MKYHLFAWLTFLSGLLLLCFIDAAMGRKPDVGSNIACVAAGWVVMIQAQLWNRK